MTSRKQLPSESYSIDILNNAKTNQEWLEEQLEFQPAERNFHESQP